MAARLAFKQRVVLPEWDGEPELVPVRNAPHRVPLVAGLVWVFTLGLGTVIQWHRSEVADYVSSALTGARASFVGSAVAPARGFMAAHQRDFNPPPAVPTARERSTAPQPVTAQAQPAELAGSAPAEPAPSTAAESEPSGHALLTAKQRKVSAGHFGRVDIVSWSGMRRLNEDAALGSWPGFESATSARDADDFNDREFMEDLRTSVRTGIAVREPVGEPSAAPGSSHVRVRPPVRLSDRPPSAAARPSRLPFSKHAKKAEEAPASTSPGGMSCEAARARYMEKIEVGRKNTARDTPLGVYESILNRGDYFSGCGVPPDVKVTICAAVQHGRAVGVTISTEPRATATHGCIARGVRRLRFPNNVRLDVVSTQFEPAR